MEKTGVKIVAKNSKAFHEYFVEERFEAGIELFGTEVKSIRLGTLNLKDAWCSVKDGELWVRQMHISPYEKGNIFNKDPIRPRRLLMHKREIQRLACQGPARRLRHRSALRLSEKLPRQGRGRAVQGQKAL